MSDKDAQDIKQAIPLDPKMRKAIESIETLVLESEDPLRKLGVSNIEMAVHNQGKGVHQPLSYALALAVKVLHGDSKLADPLMALLEGQGHKRAEVTELLQQIQEGSKKALRGTNSHDDSLFRSGYEMEDAALNKLSSALGAAVDVSPDQKMVKQTTPDTRGQGTGQVPKRQ